MSSVRHRTRHRPDPSRIAEGGRRTASPKMPRHGRRRPYPKQVLTLCGPASKHPWPGSDRPAVRSRRNLEPIDSRSRQPGLPPDVSNGFDPAAHASPTLRAPGLSRQRKIRVPPLLGLAPPMIILRENRCDKNYHASGAPGTRHSPQGSGRFGSSTIMGGPHPLWVSRCDQSFSRVICATRQCLTRATSRQCTARRSFAALGLEYTLSRHGGPMEGADVMKESLSLTASRTGRLRAQRSIASRGLPCPLPWCYNTPLGKVKMCIKKMRE